MRIHVPNVLGVSQSVVFRVCTKYRTFDTAIRRYAGGRKQPTIPREDQFLVLRAGPNRFRSAQTLRSDLLNATGTIICI
jgi:hypothetical protein